jgi:16S rRNA (guanine966-N2)-methyltransferase
MRVISGKARGIVLKSSEGLETRPTTDRVKEAIFSMIHPSIYGAVCLDLFSGSGALGIELLSRGAKAVTFVESSRSLEAIIKSNLEKTRLSNGALLVIDDVIHAMMGMPSEAFGIIVMDPPYSKGHIKQVLDMVAKRNLLKMDGILVVEHVPNDSDLLDIPMYFNKIKDKKYGKIGVTLLRRAYENCSLSGEF